ncbi:MAG: sulfatase [Planctomycetia bacterium]|nr:sulfatase [Planctomycetia bacterium]
MLLSVLLASAVLPVSAPTERPNILLVVMDDVSWRHVSATGCRAVSTPAMDRMAKNGVRFEFAFCPAPACAPSRASLLTGRAPWQNGEAACHFAGFPKELVTYPHLLANAGYHVGMTGKGWGPGDWKESGRPHNPAGPAFDDQKLVPPPGISSNDYSGNFASFLARRPKDAPFCFWFGANEAHRGFGPGRGSTEGKKLADAEVLPYWPDTDDIRSDLLDYYAEIEWVDRQLGLMLQQLERASMLENTLVVITADNGMPFPRCKSNLYDYGARVPLVIAWPKRIPGKRVVTDFTTLADLAPTFLEAAGAPVPSSVTARSLLPLLTSGKSGRVEKPRNHVVLAKEQHAWCQPQGQIAAMRAIRTDKHLFILNLRPNLWPNGDPDPQHNWNLEPFGDVDGGSERRTAKYLLMALRNGPQHRLWELSFARRPAEVLYDLERDPFQIENVAAKQEYADVRKELRGQLESHLKETGDPRYNGRPEVFDRAPYYTSHGLATAGLPPAKFGALTPQERERALLAARQRIAEWPANGDLPKSIADLLAKPR